MLAVGDKIPSFRLSNQNGVNIDSDDLVQNSNFTVIYFYPKDGTPGCTTQGCLFRDLKANFTELDCQIIGVSKGDVNSKQKFHKEQDFNFDLLADVDKTMANEFGVLKEGRMFGRNFQGIQRATFLVDRNGRVLQTWEQANPITNAKEVLVFLNSIEL